MAIPLMNADELLKMDPYEEVVQQGQVEDQPYADDASPTAESPGYIADSDSMGEDDDEDPEEDPSEEHEPEDDDKDPNEEHEPEDEDTKEDDPSEGSNETEPFKEDETTVTPPPPRHRGARISAPLGHRTSMIRKRDDIPKEDMPPQRRFLFTTLLPRCDVADSSVAAARAPRGLYDLVDTVEAGQGLIYSLSHDAWTIVIAADRVKDIGYVRALQASEHRMVTSIKDTDRREITLKIDVVRGQRTAYETELQEHQSAEDLAVTQMMRIHALEVKARTDMVADAGSSWTLKKKLTDKYYPKGEIKKLEIKLWNLRVKGNDVAAYTQRFQELALMSTKFLVDETKKVDKYISGLPDNIHGNVMSARPKTLIETIELASDLMDQKLRTYAERQNDNKRKVDDLSRNNQQQQPYKKQNVARAYTTVANKKKTYTRNLPLCAKCN
nr:reverse transcriptase domain-containing protein [Tanacetum cinerariifolium]